MQKEKKIVPSKTFYSTPAYNLCDQSQIFLWSSFFRIALRVIAKNASVIKIHVR